jgi:hypothetical protein
MTLDHVLYSDEDEDRPDVICDQNGSVVLGLCKVCGLAEVELDWYPTCPGKWAEPVEFPRARPE